MAGNLSLRFWDAGRLVLQQPGWWEVRSWPDWQLLKAGGGTAVAESGGDRLAVVAPDDTIRVDGPTALMPPPGAGRPTGLAWSGGSLVVAARASGSGRSHPAGVSARPFGAASTERSSLWRLPLDGTAPTWLYDAPPGTRIWAVQDLAGEILVELYPYGELRRPPAPPRLVVVAGEGQSRDLAPELSGACCDAAVGPDGRVAFLHGDFPHSELVFPTWFALMEGQEGRWRTLLPPQLRWARPTWSADGSRLLVTAVQGIRLGIVTVDPATGRVLVEGKDVTGADVRQRSVAMVYQQFINYPSLTVYENIASPLRVLGTIWMVGGEKHKTGQGGATEERYRRLEQYAQLLRQRRRAAERLRLRPGSRRGGHLPAGIGDRFNRL